MRRFPRVESFRAAQQSARARDSGAWDSLPSEVPPAVLSAVIAAYACELGSPRKEQKTYG